ncbi:MAG: aspartate--tRNA ligase [Lactobacillaceae bacterium]|jgi:aspartyl-tRNA synthetase|nr:aspartate--tRNA ligase [Lactobacillaceae bacterium]
MNAYRTHNCGELRLSDIGGEVKIAGWIHRKRNLGNLCFIDLRDNYGITQCVIDSSSDIFSSIKDIRAESVIGLTGTVVAREGNANKNMPTGEIELQVKSVEVHSEADVLPFQIAIDDYAPEDLRLKYRFLDLRREKLHDNILLRAKVIAAMRRLMTEQGFVEYQTPILTASSPEGARDFLVPSRVNPGKFYALPQAPQQFKQLIMVSGFDKYFQIAPCFRDEDPRADRSPGEFYQLDLEMSFATQEDVFTAVEHVMGGVFKEFANGRKVDDYPFVRIPFRESMLKYGNDKPDLRNPLIIQDATGLFGNSGFGVYDNMVKEGKKVRAIVVKGIAEKPRSFFDKMDAYAKENDMGGMAYIAFAKETVKGVAKVFSLEKLNEICKTLNFGDTDAVFFVIGEEEKVSKFAGRARTKLGEDLDLIEKNAFRFCWVVDFPMFEQNEETGRIEFSHNPFSMPQGGMDALLNKNPLDILAYQYDIVCNGVELSSGAVRNHRPEIMYKAFEIAGYGPEVVDSKFGGMISAFKYGAPPHAGCAPGVDRSVMLLADEPSIREVILFPMNGKAQDLMMQAPNVVSEEQLKELRIKLV